MEWRKYLDIVIELYKDNNAYFVAGICFVILMVFVFIESRQRQV